MKSTIIWFAVITAALITAGCVVLWIHQRWREADRTLLRLRLRERRQHAKDLERLAWENRRVIGFDVGNVPAAT